MKFRVNNHVLETPKLESNKRIVSISDIHSNIAVLPGLLKVLETLKPDFICIPGDLSDKSNEDKSEIVTWLRELSSVFKTILSNGNHDMVKSENKKWSISENLEFYKELDKIPNLVYLRGLFETHFDDNITFSVLNMPAEWYRNREGNESKIVFEETLNALDYSRLKKSSFNVLLSHSPNRFIEKNKLISSEKFDILSYFDLILSGHNHDGMVPKFIQPLIKNQRGIVGPYLKFFQENAFGTWDNGETALILSGGVTKCADSSEVAFAKDFINSIYIPDVEQIDVVTAPQHKLIKSKQSVLKIKH